MNNHNDYSNTCNKIMIAINKKEKKKLSLTCAVVKTKIVQIIKILVIIIMIIIVIVIIVIYKILLK